MKHLKSFENAENFIKMTDENKTGRDIYYYLLCVDSIDKFNFALDKIGIKEDFYNDIWENGINIKDYILPKFQQKKLYLSVDYWSYTFEPFDHKPSYKELFSMRDDDDRNDKVIYGGDIIVNDYEIDSKIYNL